MSDTLSAAAQALAVVLTTGEPVSDPLVLAALAQSRAECAEVGGDRLVYPPDFVAEIDLTGDGAPDRVVREAGAFCGPDGGYLHPGSGGAPVHAIVGATVQSLGHGALATADVAFEIDGALRPAVRVVLLGLHGMGCGGAGGSPCLLAHVWDGERLVSVLDGLDVWLEP